MQIALAHMSEAQRLLSPERKRVEELESLYGEDWQFQEIRQHVDEQLVQRDERLAPVFQKGMIEEVSLRQQSDHQFDMGMRTLCNQLPLTGMNLEWNHAWPLRDMSPNVLRRLKHIGVIDGSQFAHETRRVVHDVATVFQSEAVSPTSVRLHFRSNTQSLSQILEVMGHTKWISHLEHLHLSTADSVAFDSGLVGLHLVNSLPHTLRSLTIDGPHNPWSGHHPVLDSSCDPCYFLKLERLTLDRSLQGTEFIPTVFEDPEQRFPILRYLSLKDCHLEDETFNQVLDHFPASRLLEIDARGNNANAKSFLFLSKGSPHLRILTEKGMWHGGEFLAQKAVASPFSEGIAQADSLVMPVRLAMGELLGDV